MSPLRAVAGPRGRGQRERIEREDSFHVREITSHLLY
jgi:hypothetical protein